MAVGSVHGNWVIRKGEELLPPRDHSDEIRSGCRIDVFHSALELRPSVLRWADELRARAYLVQTPDLCGGETFDTIQRGFGRSMRSDLMLSRMTDFLERLTPRER